MKKLNNAEIVELKKVQQDEKHHANIFKKYTGKALKVSKKKL
jgi:hypothetical protein